MTRTSIASIILLLMSTAVRASASIARTAELNARIPVIGCKSDGQLGPRAAPSNGYRTASLSSRVASRLAYYKSEEGIGVLAPRNWYCFGTYGSSGNTLFVSPKPIDSRKLFSVKWNGFAGPAIVIEQEYGGTSGRFGVASMIARVFPAHRGFVQKVMAEDIGAGINPPNMYKYGPYPKDKLEYDGKDVVKYRTPGGADELGTFDGLQKNDSPICGVAILTGSTPNLIYVAVRLSQKMMDHLAPTIISQAEQDALSLPSR